MLSTLQTQSKARLDEQAYFSAQPAIPVIVESLKDIANALDLRLAKLGVAVIIITPLCSTRAMPSPYPVWDRVRVVARVVENVIINRSAAGTGQPASSIAEAVAFYLHAWAPAVLGKNKLMVEQIALVDDPVCLSYDVHLFSGGVTSAAPVRV